MRKAFKVGSKINYPYKSLSGGASLEGGSQGFGKGYNTISAGKFSPTKNGGKRGSNPKGKKEIKSDTGL